MRRIRRAGCGALGVVVAALAMACGGGDDDGPTGKTGSIQVALNPTTLAAEQGGHGSFIATLTRNGGFSGVVTLAVSGLPAGIGASITPTQLSGTAATAAIDVTVAASVAPGSYTATLTATAPGLAEATAIAQVTVAPAPAYTLSVAPAALTIAAGASGGATVNIDRTNFAGGVTLAVQNPPAGISAAFSPNPSTTNASGLVVSVAASAAPGNHALTITGTAAGLTDRAASVQVTVTAPPASATVEYRFCDAADVPDFFAYQDGTGAWRAVTGTTTSGVTRYTFDLTQGRGGVLTVYRYSSAGVASALPRRRPAGMRPTTARVPGPQGTLRSRLGAGGARIATRGRSVLADAYETYLVYGSTAEIVQDGLDACVQAPPTKTVTGTIAGIAAGQYGVASLGPTTVIFDGATATNPVTFADVPEGKLDLLGSRITTPGMPPDRILVVRDLDVPDGGALPSTIDFNGPAASAPATATATITGGAGDRLEIFTKLMTATSEPILWFDLAPSPATQRPWAGLNAGAMRSGEFHGLVVWASTAGSPGDLRVMTKYVGPVANETLALPPVAAVPTATQVAAGAYPRFRFQGAISAAYDKSVWIEVLSTAESGNAYHIVASGAYRAASGSPLAYDVTMPDVAGLAGFPAGARLTAGENDASVEASGFTGPGTFYLLPMLGGETWSSIRNLTLSVP